MPIPILQRSYLAEYHSRGPKEVGIKGVAKLLLEHEDADPNFTKTQYG